MMNLSLLLNWLLQTLVAFVSTIAFSVIFHAPRRESLCVGVTGGAGWLMYLVCTHLGCGVAAASFCATLALAFLARLFAILRKTPVTVYMICGIFPLVPGAGIYYTGYYFFTHNNSLCLEKGLETIKIAVAMALGIGIVLSLPWQLFVLRRRK